MRKIVGLTEEVTLMNTKLNFEKSTLARIDTGATRSSIDTDLAEKLGLGPIIKEKHVRNVYGSYLRPVIKANIKIKDEIIEAEFTLADRSNMRYKILIGQNLLKKGNFLVDPCEE